MTDKKMESLELVAEHVRKGLIDRRSSNVPTDSILILRAAFVSLLLFPIGACVIMIAYELLARALRRWAL